MKKLAITILALVFVLPAVAEVKVGYIDLQRAIQATKEGKKAKKLLEGEVADRKKKIQKAETDIKKMQSDLEKKHMVLSEDVKKQKQREIQTEMMGYQKLLAQSQQEMVIRERDLTKPILEKLQKVIAKIAKKDGYTVILEKSEQSVLWAKKDIDLTDKVVTEFEKTK